VPGTWILPPQDGLYWTPGYWAYEDGNYVYYDGYWGDEVGFYGGVDYGYGYEGDGYDGGYWQNGGFFYNDTVNNIAGVGIAHAYSKQVAAHENAKRVSYNGGEGGLRAKPTEQQQAFAHEKHVGPTTLQTAHVKMASQDPSLRESNNKGLPPIAATSRPDNFKGEGVIAAKTAGERPSGQSIPQGKGTSGGMTPESVGAPSGGMKGQAPGGPSGERSMMKSMTLGNKPGNAGGGMHKLVEPNLGQGAESKAHIEEHKAAPPHPSAPHPQPMMPPRPQAPPHPMARPAPPPGKPKKKP
jgi:hypothetical protein